MSSHTPPDITSEDQDKDFGCKTVLNSKDSGERDKDKSMARILSNKKSEVKKPLSPWGT